MNLSAAADAIQALLTAEWSHPDVPIAIVGEPFVAPQSDSGPLPFLLLRVDWNGGETISIGAPGDNLQRRMGLIWVIAFVAVKTGSKRMQDLASDAATIFESANFSGVVCGAAAPGGEADEETGLYVGQAVSIEFTYDETA